MEHNISLTGGFQPFDDDVRATTLIKSWWIYLLLHGRAQRQSANNGNAAGTPGHIRLRSKMPLSLAHGLLYTSDVNMIYALAFTLYIDTYDYMNMYHAYISI